MLTLFSFTQWQNNPKYDNLSRNFHSFFGHPLFAFGFLLRHQKNKIHRGAICYIKGQMRSTARNMMYAKDAKECHHILCRPVILAISSTVHCAANSFPVRNLILSLASHPRERLLLCQRRSRRKTRVIRRFQNDTSDGMLQNTQI